MEGVARGGSHLRHRVNTRERVRTRSVRRRGAPWRRPSCHGDAYTDWIGDRDEEDRRFELLDALDDEPPWRASIEADVPAKAARRAGHFAVSSQWKSSRIAPVFDCALGRARQLVVIRANVEP
eukprot:scaffold108019_cov28-Tisochrysis_lutea.AAC.2